MLDTNQAVEPQKIIKSLTFQILKEKGSYYLWSENKGADQLCSYCIADLCLCFSICTFLFFDTAAHIIGLVGYCMS